MNQIKYILITITLILIFSSFISCGGGDDDDSTPNTESTNQNDNTAPADLSYLRAKRNDNKIDFTWINPEDEDYAGFKICRSDSYCDKNTKLDSNCEAIYESTETTTTSWSDSTAKNGNTYCYQFFTYDKNNNYSEGVKTSVSLKNDKDLTWTIMIYLDADNDLELYAIMNLGDLEKVKLANKNVNIIALVDRSSSYSTLAGNWSDTRLFKMQYEGEAFTIDITSPELESEELGLTKAGKEELDMGDYKTVRKFVNFCQNNYPADRYALIFWDHGGGWKNRTPDTNNPTKLVCEDADNGTTLFTYEIDKAIEGLNIDLVGFDACIMAMIEVAYEVKKSADIMVASEENEHGIGWPYKEILDNFIQKEQKSTKDLANSIVAGYKEKYEKNELATTLSALDLSKIEPIKNAIDVFQENLKNSKTRSEIREVGFTKTKFYATHYKDPDYSSNKFEYIFMDLYHFTENFPTVKGSEDIRKAIDNAVIENFYRETYSENSHGISIYFRTVISKLTDNYSNKPSSDFDPEENDIYDFMQESKWDEFLKWLSEDL